MGSPELQNSSAAAPGFVFYLAPEKGVSAPRARNPRVISEFLLPQAAINTQMGMKKTEHTRASAHIPWPPAGENPTPDAATSDRTRAVRDVW